MSNIVESEVMKMAEAINVNPTPIQRNTLDVATELTQLYFKARTPADVEEIQDVYSKFYAVALTMQSKHPRSLSKLIPEDLVKKIAE
jgi:hypothetical protein